MTSDALMQRFGDLIEQGRHQIAEASARFDRHLHRGGRDLARRARENVDYGLDAARRWESAAERWVRDHRLITALVVAGVVAAAVGIGLAAASCCRETAREP